VTDDSNERWHQLDNELAGFVETHVVRVGTTSLGLRLALLVV
jgi:hypothetical protein